MGGSAFCVGFGVLRDIPIPSGDGLVSLRPVRQRLLTPMPNLHLSPPCVRLHVTAGSRLPPESLCETLRRRKQEDCRHRAGEQGKSRADLFGCGGLRSQPAGGKRSDQPAIHRIQASPAENAARTNASLTKIQRSSTLSNATSCFSAIQHGDCAAA